MYITQSPHKMKDIENIEDIKVFVNGFYSKIQEDDLLADVFALRIQGEAWERHLNRMYDFWNTVLFFQSAYKGNPFARHIGLPVQAHHFERWISLFHQTIDAHFQGPIADETKLRGSNMAALFLAKMEHIEKMQAFKPIL